MTTTLESPPLELTQDRPSPADALRAMAKKLNPSMSPAAPPPPQPRLPSSKKARRPRPPVIAGREPRVGEKGNKGKAPLEIDVELIRSLAGIQCTMKEMAGCLRCSVDTLERRYIDVIREAQEQGRKSLRRYQLELAKKSAAMAIFLGKQYLGQRDESYNAPQYTKIVVERS